MSNDKLPLIFFYGSFINSDVLKQAGFESCDGFRPALIAGYRFEIAPRANVKKQAGSIVYGVLTRGSHQDLERLYTYALDELGELYLPHPVSALDLEGHHHAAMTYVCPNMQHGDVEPAYVDRIVEPARTLGFPNWYVEHIESFQPSSDR